MTTPDATYVFCLVQSPRASLREFRAPSPAARATHPGRSRHLGRCDAPLDRFGAEISRTAAGCRVDPRHALAHASVIEFFFRGAPVIPLKLFTLFSSDDRVREHLLPRRPRLHKLFGELRGLEEWGVRIIAGQAEAESARTLKSGRDYLEVKKRLIRQNAAPPRATIPKYAALKTLGRMAVRTQGVFPPPAKGRPFVSGASFSSRRRAATDGTKLPRSSLLHSIDTGIGSKSPALAPYHFVSR
jgi:hypothetical protein